MGVPKDHWGAMGHNITVGSYDSELLPPLTQSLLHVKTCVYPWSLKPITFQTVFA